MDATALLRPGLLDGRVVALGGESALGAPLAALGATLVPLPATLDEEEAARRVAEALTTHGRCDALVHDLRPTFDAAGEDALRTALDTAWVTIRAVATAAFISGRRGGKLTLIAPPLAADPTAPGAAAAEAARAATENLARTLSIEWARHGVRSVAIAPGSSTTDAELAALAAYLASPAGDYFSGCAVTLGGEF